MPAAVPWALSGRFGAVEGLALRGVRAALFGLAVDRFFRDMTLHFHHGSGVLREPRARSTDARRARRDMLFLTQSTARVSHPRAPSRPNVDSAVIDP